MMPCASPSKGSPKKIYPGQAIHNHRLGCSTNNCDRPNRDLAYAVPLSGKIPSPLGAAGAAAADDGRHWRNVRGPRSGEPSPSCACQCLLARPTSGQPTAAPSGAAPRWWWWELSLVRGPSHRDWNPIQSKPIRIRTRKRHRLPSHSISTGSLARLPIDLNVADRRFVHGQ